MDNRRTSICSSVMSGSTDVSLYNNNNNVDYDDGKNSIDLKLERSATDPNDGSRNYFLRWKGFEGNLIR
jgi:hypothetical protein